MRKQTLGVLASFVVTAAAASANPWANYDWSTGRMSPGQAASGIPAAGQASAAHSYRSLPRQANAYPLVEQKQSAAQRQATVQRQPAGQQATSVPRHSVNTASETVFTPSMFNDDGLRDNLTGGASPVTYSPASYPNVTQQQIDQARAARLPQSAQSPLSPGHSLQTQAVEPALSESFAGMTEDEIKRTSYRSQYYAAQAQQAVAPPTQAYMTLPSQSISEYGDPAIFPQGYEYSGDTCNTCPAPAARNYEFNFLSEALFFDRRDNFDTLRNFSDGPANSGFGFDDVFSGSESTGYRIVAELLTGDPCSCWQHGFGVSYFDPGRFGSASGGTFAFGIAFDAGTKGTDPSTLAGCFVLSQNTFFASLARVAAVNTLTNNEQEEFEGLGPDPSTVAFDPARRTGSENFALPTWTASYDSEINSIGAHFLVAQKRQQRLKFGVGWQQYNVNEGSFVAISGPLHATDATFFTTSPPFPQAPALRNNGLEHGSFLDNTRNDGSDPGLVYLGPPGAEDGFDAQNDGTLGLTDGSGPDFIGLLSRQSTDNTLNGINFFAQSQVLRTGRFDVKARLDLGVYHNQAEATVSELYQELTSNGSAYGRSFNESRDVVSLVAGTSLDAGFWVTDHLRLYGGYEIMFISGVALSPEQESGIVGNQFSIQHDGDVILQGAKAGFEFLY